MTPSPGGQVSAGLALDRLVVAGAPGFYCSRCSNCSRRAGVAWWSRLPVDYCVAGLGVKWSASTRLIVTSVPVLRWLAFERASRETPWVYVDDVTR